MPLSPFYVSGLSDAESCFFLSLDNKNYPRFSFFIGMNLKDKDLISNINSFFNKKGRISIYSPNSEIRVTFENLDAINNYIIPHFDKYPLIGIKSLDYQLFKTGINMINNGDYKTAEGLKNFSKISISMNEGYKKNIINLFPDLINTSKNFELYDKSIVTTMNPWWVSGFIDGDGSFSASIKYKNIEKTRIAFQPSLSISQHSNNILLFNQFKEFFNCGNVYDKKSSDGQHNHIQYQVSSTKDIKSFILPHFESYPLMSYKKNVYQVWSELIILLSNVPSENRNKKAIEFVNQIKKFNN